jgi:hypothetical protein
MVGRGGWEGEGIEGRGYMEGKKETKKERGTRREKEREKHTNTLSAP